MPGLSQQSQKEQDLISFRAGRFVLHTDHKPGQLQAIFGSQLVVGGALMLAGLFSRHGQKSNGRGLEAQLAQDVLLEECNRTAPIPFRRHKCKHSIVIRRHKCIHSIVIHPK